MICTVELSMLLDLAKRHWAIARKGIVSMITQEELTMRDERIAAYHEAGHAAMFEHEGIQWEATLNPPDISIIGRDGYTGHCNGYAVMHGFRHAALSWAGFLAEYMSKAHSFDETASLGKPDGAVASKIVDYVLSVYLDEPECFSHDDKNGIERTQFKVRACRYAARILLNHWDTVEAIAQALMADGEVESFEMSFRRRELDQPHPTPHGTGDVPPRSS